ncbi:MAG: tetratricopeptide repeat protein [Burkholderiaceae bacterium]
MKPSSLALPGRIAVLLACGLLNACANPPVARGEPVSATVRQDKLPDVALDEALLYQILASELALQRGQPSTAYATYLSLAQKTRDPRLAKRAVEIALYEQNLDRALEGTQLWETLAPNNRQAAHSATVLLIAQNRLNEAAPRLAERLAEDKTLRADDDKETTAALDPYAAVQRELARAPDPVAAYDTLHNLFAKDLKAPRAQLALANQAGQAKLFNQAIEHARQAQRLDDSAEATLSVAQFLQVRDGNFSGAMNAIEQYLTRHPDDATVRLTLAKLYATERRWPEARTAFQTLLDKEPQNPTLLYGLGVIAVKMNDRPAAKRYFDAFLANRDVNDDRDVNTVYGMLSQLAEDDRDWPAAMAWLGRIPDGDSRIDVLTRRAGLLTKQGEYAAADFLLQQAKPADELERTQLTLGKAALLREQGKYDAALVLLSAAVISQPDQPDMLYERAMIAEKLDRMDQAEADLRRVIELRPDSAHAYNALGYSLADRNQRLTEARTLIDHAVKLAPDDPFIMDSLGWVQYRQNQVAAAETTLRKAYELKQDNEIALHLGEVLWVQGRRDDALVLWRAVAEREPNNTALKALLTRLAVTL